MKARPAKDNAAIAAAVLQERNRLSRELHDRALQHLTSVRAHLEFCHQHLRNPEALERELQDIDTNLDRAITEIRNLLAENRVAEQMQAGSLERRLKEELAIFSSRAGFQIDFRCTVNAHDMPMEAEKELYFTLREGVLNAVRHARASEIHLSLGRSQSGYEASLSDNGIGFDPAASEGGNHYGLKGMRERIEKLGGTFTIHSAPGKGTKLDMRIPLAGR